MKKVKSDDELQKLLVDLANEDNLDAFKNAIVSEVDEFVLRKRAEDILFAATKGKDFKVGKFLIEHFKNKYGKDLTKSLYNNSNNLLHLAVLANNFLAVEYLIKENNTLVDELNRSRHTPLLLANRKGYSEIAAHLKENSTKETIGPCVRKVSSSTKNEKPHSGVFQPLFMVVKQCSKNSSQSFGKLLLRENKEGRFSKSPEEKPKRVRAFTS